MLSLVERTDFRSRDRATRTNASADERRDATNLINSARWRTALRLTEIARRRQTDCFTSDWLKMNPSNRWPAQHQRRRGECDTCREKDDGAIVAGIGTAISMQPLVECRARS